MCAVAVRRVRRANAYHRCLTAHLCTHLGHATPTHPYYHSSVRAVAIDFGGRRVGLAVSDASRTLARPLETLTRPHGSSDSAGRRRGARCRGETGTRRRTGRHARRRRAAPARRVAERADAESGAVRRGAARGDARGPWSCRTSGSPAMRPTSGWRCASATGSKRKARLDAAAAAVILQEFLDTRPARRRCLPTNAPTDSRHRAAGGDCRRRGRGLLRPRGREIPGLSGRRPVRRDRAGHQVARDRPRARRGRRRPRRVDVPARGLPDRHRAPAEGGGVSLRRSDLGEGRRAQAGARRHLTCGPSRSRRG